MSTTPSNPLSVVIAGGGVAAIEATLALRDLAGDRVRVTLVSPRADFVLTPLAVGEPFAVEHARRRPLADVAAELGAYVVHGAVRRVLPDVRAVELSDGDELRYDVLLVTVGGHPYPGLGHALTFRAEQDPIALAGIVADLEEGYSKSVAFVVPAGVSWPLPAYELALLTARQVRSMGIDDARITLVTAERRPLCLFGERAADTVAQLLDEAGIAVETRADAVGAPGGRLTLGTGRELRAERVVALPLVEGPRLRGLPRDEQGFIPTDEHARVNGVPEVFAAGDCTDFPIKQGGIATQQAEAAAEMIAARAGAEIRPKPFEPVLRGWLLTGDARRFLSRRMSDSGRGGEASAQPLWWPPTKVAGRYLGPWLAAQDERSATPPAQDAGFAVEVPLPRERDAAAAMALDPLGPLPPRGGAWWQHAR